MKRLSALILAALLLAPAASFAACPDGGETDRSKLQKEKAQRSLLAQEEISLKRANEGIEDARDKVTNLYKDCMGQLASTVEAIKSKAGTLASMDYTGIIYGVAAKAVDTAIEKGCQQVNQMTSEMVNKAVEGMGASRISDAISTADSWSTATGGYYSQTYANSGSWRGSTSDPVQETQGMADSIRRSGKGQVNTVSSGDM